MTLEEKYKSIPKELRDMKRWVLFKVEMTSDGRTTKIPYNAINFDKAKSNDITTWTTFRVALKGCEKYGADGLGFMLGGNIFGVDLDNHADKNGNVMPRDKFEELADEFITCLDSYAERSQSGEGVHIICQGHLPQGARRKGNVEMYDTGRFFACTGDVIRPVPVKNCEKEIIPLWEKYVKNEVENKPQIKKVILEGLKLADEEIIKMACSSENGDKFYRYYHDGDLSMNGGDHSGADMAFCCSLAFWCNWDKVQMDRIFRNSALMRDKWDEYRGAKTYGEITIDQACDSVTTSYVSDKPIFTIRKKESKFVKEINAFESEMNVDQNGEPIFKEKKITKKFSYNDTGNAERFYAYFGELFKYNKTDKCFMFWTGKNWTKDVKDIIRKYANKLIEYMHKEEQSILAEVLKLQGEGKKDEAKQKQDLYDACCKNTARVANKAGKDAMLSEFSSIYDVACESNEFDKDDFLLNTDSGIVNLKNGEIMPFDRTRMISKNTGVKVSYEEPTIWLKFLYSIFDNGNEEDTNAMIKSLQTCLGYSLSGSTREQVMFLLYGGGSNGKTTMTEQFSHILGDYGDNISSSVLMQSKNANSTAVYSIAKLQTVRFVETDETDDGGKLAEAELKRITGGGEISAQFKFGHEFSFKPKFKIWMSTNNKPIIRGTDLGIWRRIIPFEFKNSFTGAKKDKDLPLKLQAESDKILGWCIKGFQLYQEHNDLLITDAQRKSLDNYKAQMDIVTQFLNKECSLENGATIECKELYQKYKEWAKDNTEFTIKESKFSAELKNKGITIEKSSMGKNYYRGVRINGTFTIRNKE